MLLIQEHLSLDIQSYHQLKVSCTLSSAVRLDSKHCFYSHDCRAAVAAAAISDEFLIALVGVVLK